MFQILYKSEKEVEQVVKYEHCKCCVYYESDKHLCTRYRMISDPEQTCKSHKRK